MKEVYTKKIVGYMVHDDYYCTECWKQYLEEKKMTGKISIDEQVWEHDLISDDVDEVEGAAGELRCQRCGNIFAPGES